MKMFYIKLKYSKNQIKPLFKIVNLCGMKDSYVVHRFSVTPSTFKKTATNVFKNSTNINNLEPQNFYSEELLRVFFRGP